MTPSGPLKSSGGMPGKIRNPQQGLKELETLEAGGRGGLRNSGTQQNSHIHVEEERRMSLGTSFIVVVCSSIFALCLAFLIYGFIGGWQQQMLIRFSVDSQRIHIVHDDDDDKRTIFTPTLKRGSIEKGGIFEIWADDEQTLMAGLGYAHTIDRMVAMALTRIVVQGRLSELIAGDDPQALAVDTFMRKKGFYRQAKTALELISKSQAKEDKEIFNLMSSYSSGVNHRIHEVFSSDSSSFSSSINSSNILDTILDHLPIAPVDLTLVAGIKTLEPWTPIDSLAIINLMSYLGLAEVQEVAELIILDVLQQSERNIVTSKTPEELKRWKTKQDALQAIHSPYLDDILSPSAPLRTATLEAIRDVRLPSKRNGKVPASIWDALSEGMTKQKHASLSGEIADEFLGARPTGGSNNWVISGKLTESGSPIMASDPHLEINRLPAIWYEVVLHRSWEDSFALGITVPGVPGLIMGRSSFMSWSFTYGFMDMIDLFLEKCSGLTCINENSEEVKMNVHRETILRKGATPIDLVVYETPRGDSLEVNDTYITSKDEIPRLESGIYLARAYTHQRWLAGAPSLRSLLLLGRSKTVQDAQDFAKNVELSLNLLFADTEGNIGYQQTGLMPDRPQGRSGLSPFLGWLPGSDWKPTRLPADRLGRLFNPSSGFIATANDDEHTLKEPVSVNLHMGGYRRERVEELLKSSITRKEPFDINDMKWIQRDIFSLQARRYTGLVDTLLDELKLESLRPLRDWDLRYTYNSFGAGIFEEFYARLMDEVFSVPFEKDLWCHLKESYLVRPYFHLYDKMIFEWNNQSGDSGEIKGLFWEEGRTKEEVYMKVLLEMAKNETQEGAHQQYFEHHSVTFHNILFEEKIPRMTALLGYDQGPLLLPGGRATIVQHVSFKGATGKRIVVGPSWRHISELSEGGISLTSLPGGPSDQVLSELYANDLHRWANFRYKRLPRFETEKARKKKAD